MYLKVLIFAFPWVRGMSETRELTTTSCASISKILSKRRVYKRQSGCKMTRLWERMIPLKSGLTKPEQAIKSEGVDETLGGDDMGISDIFLRIEKTP